MSDEAREHQWARTRLVLWASGLLGEAATSRFERHLARCGLCVASVEVIRTGEFAHVDRGEHLPTALVARWDRRSIKLRGLERALVRRHLERCDLCRGQIETLGYVAELPYVAGVELAEARASVAGKSAGLARILLMPRWMQLTTALLASAACVVVVLVLGRQPRTGMLARQAPPGSTPVPGGSTMRSAPEIPSSSVPTRSTASEALPTLLALGPEAPDAVSFSANVRGAGAQGTTPSVRPPSPGRPLRLRVPLEAQLAEGNRAEIAILDADGRVVRQMEARVATLRRAVGAACLLVRDGTPALDAGDYRLRFVVRGGGVLPDTMNYNFHVEK